MPKAGRIPVGVAYDAKVIQAYDGGSMSELVAFPLRVPKQLKERIGSMAKSEGKKTGPYARELLAIGYEARLLRLRQLKLDEFETESETPPTNETEKGD